MPDDDRTRRRLGDETKGRIADLASGWSVDESENPAPAAPAPAKPPAATPASAVKTPTPKPIATESSGARPKPMITESSGAKPRGDQTNARIAELASGWSVDSADTPEDSPALSEHRGPAPFTGPPDAPARKKPKTLPPPPPGSQQRKALEAAILETNTGPAPKSEPIRAKQPTVPPPVPPGARRSPTQQVPALPDRPSKSGMNAKPPSTVKSGPTETGTVNVSGMIGGMAPSQQLATPGLPGVGAVKTSTPFALPLPATPPAATPPRPPPAILRPPISAQPPDESGEATEVDPNAHLSVPVGEFDDGGTLLDKDKLRVAYEQSTIKRDAASALLGLPEQPLTVVGAPSVELLLGESAAQITRGDSQRGDATSIETAKFERGDPTLGPDATSIDPPGVGGAGAGGKLRTQAALRRKRGIGGDVKYVATAVLGVRRARRELGELELQQATRQKSRARHLLTLGRAAVGSEGYDHPALNKAREMLAIVEDERSQHTATVTAADSELMRVRTDRAEKAKAYAEAITNIDTELAEVTKKIEPLEKEVVSASRKAAELHDSLRRIDAQIAQTEASKVNVKSQKLDPASIQAELATLKADRLAVTRDEPRIAAELDALNPRIAALDARRSDARKRRIEIDDEEKKDQGRAQELLAAIGAKRKVVDRAAADAEQMRDKVLLELGERIYVDRPTSMQFELAPVDAIDVELGVTDRRLMELKEIIGSVDKLKLARGIAVIVLALSAVGAFVWWLIYMLA
ncbi:MAG: hypothetical protein M4D80_09245 [Myxococcota bacterium]|nr:hypothetical protein [Myxococcota bacterium]